MMKMMPIDGTYKIIFFNEISLKNKNDLPHTYSIVVGKCFFIPQQF